VITDESGAPWPYEPVEQADPEPGVPTWACPTGDCDCHPPTGEEQKVDHRIVFFDSEAVRMPGARCRIVENGKLLNKESPYADGKAEIGVKLRPGARSLEIEWSPAHVPQQEPYPFRKLYHVDLGDSRDNWVHRRLHNIGFSQEPMLEDNVRDFQRAYHHAVTGRPEDVEGELGVYHDRGALPPLPKTQRAKLDLAAPPAPAGPSPGGGTKAKGSVTGVKPLKLLVRVRTRATRPLAGVTVRIGPEEIKQDFTTDTDGFANLDIDPVALGKLGDEPFVDVEARFRHHGPDPGTKDSVKAGPLSVSVLVEGKDWAPVEKQTQIDTKKPSTPGFGVSPRGRYLDLVLMDACMNRGEIGSEAARRLTRDQVQLDNISSHKDGTVTLGPKSEYTFKHDASTGEFDDCDDKKCVLEGPDFMTPLTLLDNVVRQIRWYGFQDDPKGLPDGKIDPANLEKSFTSHRLGVKAMKTLGPLAQRNLVGVVRLCVRLRNMMDIVAIYTQGVGADGSGSAHGVGLACDFAGCSTKLPSDPSRTPGGPPPSASGDITFKVVLGVDFVVLYHWGLIPQWDPTTVAANPGLSVFWKRQPWTKPDSGVNFEADPTGATNRNANRLDPSTLVPPAAPNVAKHLDLASAIFGSVFNVAVEEYTDDEETLGPLPAGKTEPAATLIDAQVGHKIEHPDYGVFTRSAKDGRFAHRNHLHFQFGTTTPKANVR
jgi:hypothetical protein